MITIQVDEKACVSCTLCVDACETRVFAFNEARGVPEVVKAGECFGCLACSAICPANAIDHAGVPRPMNFYYDPHSLEMLSKMTGDPADAVPAVVNGDVRKGLDDLGARLLSLGAVLSATLRSGLPAVGTFAGRTLANQLPRYRVPKDFEEALALAIEEFAPAWQLEPTISGDTLSITVKDCFLRKLALKHGIETGGELCTLFYHYLAGYLSRMGKVRLRHTGTERGCDACTYTAQIHPS
jgi:ferredoxin